MKDKGKPAKDLTPEERLASAVWAIWYTFWAWFQEVEKMFGYDKALELMRNVGRNLGRSGPEFYQEYFGFKPGEADQQTLINIADHIHDIWGFDCPWTVVSPTVAYEEIKTCPVWDYMPPDKREEYIAKGTCSNWCDPLRPELYPKMGKVKVVRKASRPKGDPDCIFQMEHI